MPWSMPAFGLGPVSPLWFGTGLTATQKGRSQPLGNVYWAFPKELQDSLLCLSSTVFHSGRCVLEVNLCRERETVTAGGWEWLPWQILLFLSWWIDLGSLFYCIFSATELLARAGSCLKPPGILSEFIHMLERILLLSAALGVGQQSLDHFLGSSTFTTTECVWKDFKRSSSPIRVAGAPSTWPGCSEPQLTWPRTPSRDGATTTSWEICASACPPSQSIFCS